MHRYDRLYFSSLCKFADDRQDIVRQNIGGNNGTGYLANQMSNDAGRDLLLQAINGRADALSQLATMTGGNIDQVRTVLGQILREPSCHCKPDQCPAVYYGC